MLALNTHYLFTEGLYSFMWGKTMEREGTPLKSNHLDDERSQGHAALSQTPRTGASVGKTMRFLGEIHSDEELYFDGDIEGTLDVSHRLTIGPNGKVKATVKAKELVVRGSIQGNVEAAGRIVIMNGASIVGDVKTAGIVIEDGAFFKGGIDILRTEPEAAPGTLPAALKSHGAGA
ncbi:MAG TPA: polymer-forming cytoskeletal protein [Bryobacteraceae bacterium]|nr:polymer-forming cytoskeletal protein [Bryobacteraceae bacterium]